MNEFKNLMIGDVTTSVFLAAFLMACLGAILSLFMQALNRDPKTPRSPFKFSWDFLWSDNAKRIAVAIILIYVAIRFAPELMGAKVTMWAAFGIGFGLDKIAQMLKTTGVLGKEKGV